MPTVAEIQKLVLDLPETQRAELLMSLRRSLPPALDDEDDDLAEALRRDAELTAHPEIGISPAQLDERIRALRLR